MVKTDPQMLRELKAKLAKLKREFKRYARHEDSCGIWDGRGVCSCGMQRVLDKL